MRFSTNEGGKGKGKGKGKGGKGGKGKGKGKPEPEGPPEEMKVLGEFMHTAEDLMVCKVTLQPPFCVPHFNAGIWTVEKAKIGKVDDVLGSLKDILFTVKPEAGVQAAGYQPGDVMHISTEKLLPLHRFTTPPGKGKGKGGKGKGKGKG
eukprot:TRINITY_DN6065_c0_g1_i2.p2 TRINITY_DN6065_c0_g1~~TRINITY_DN6065_c0_g1_i2.p2  ORF type:complete len:149 (+),score=41.84 TRINITY_DN6065_c0_g1_i2:55-501(+)